VIAADIGTDGASQDARVTIEKHQSARRPIRERRKSRSQAASAAIALEAEITSLRRRMEDAFVRCESLTSDDVMTVSRILDDKINDYMRMMQKN